MVHGIVLVNKPQDLTSNAVLQRVKRLFNARKAGHGGSLDPLATGMLPICLGEATKACHYMLNADKCYEVVGRLGETTDTGDSMGAVIARQPFTGISTADMNRVLTLHRGLIQQVPPMYSALKHKGKPLYEYARRGITLERPARAVVITKLELHDVDDDRFHLTVACSKGTYIRSLVESIGNALGFGAHVVQLHRVYTAGFEAQTMHTLDELECMDAAALSSCLLPPERSVLHLKQVTVDADALIKLRQGQMVYHDAFSTALEMVRVHDNRGGLVGFAELDSDGQLRPKRLLAFGTP